MLIFGISGKNRVMENQLEFINLFAWDEILKEFLLEMEIENSKLQIQSLFL